MTEETVSHFSQNNLYSSLNPYLLQHSDNPVYWQGWADKVIDFARCENKPILLSIGYSSCHWCHVMEKESFSDPSTAMLMNKHFVSIKVDREERPDLDKLYQQAHSIIHGRAGGWPLTVFLEPKSLMPFFIGTYFPATTTHGVHSFSDILNAINTIYTEKTQDVDSMIQLVQSKLNQPLPLNEDLVDDKDVLASFIEQFLQLTDKEWGGLQGAPKFPQPTLLKTLLHIIICERPKQSEALYQAIMLSAQSMSKVGLKDHLGGGFFRYCIDHYWGVPHFEKMLSDNALLLSFYSALADFNKEGVLAENCHHIYQWLNNALRGASGGFFSSQDADTDGVEGGSYLFDKEEIKSRLEPREWTLAKVAFGLQQAPNVDGLWHLHQWFSAESLAEKLSLPLKQVQWSLGAIRQKLLDYRNHRPQPPIDKKILVSWNALTVSGLFHSGQLVNRPEFIDDALNTLDYIRQHLWRSDQLFCFAIDDHVYQSGFLDDYVFLSQALLDRLQYQWNDNDFCWLLDLVDQMIVRFDLQDQGFGYSDQPDCAIKSHLFNDDALPNSQVMVIKALWQVALFSGNSQYHQLAQNLLALARDQASAIPLSHASTVDAMLAVKHQKIVVLRGEMVEILPWRDRLMANYSPYTSVFVIANRAQLNPELNEKYPSQDSAVAYLCDASQCYRAFDSIESLEQQLRC